ncbi:Sugar transporter ERD6-like [Seminavis robusta]|uniref:Hexose transporter 1 n=1 Tax=Seminavis robusta TaxID=568900 RepID=A0A9N8E2D0_9STRA|nr:Sugar transporter ERD6-like [Seminavis robusta]|eukprot:Sro579_g169990.1 Sugar transporter ERD6-like (532) ;mRNA; r:30768-32657
MTEPESSADYVMETSSKHPPPIHSHVGEHHADTGGREIPISGSVKMFAMCAAINSCNLGYDIGVSTPAAKIVQEQWGLSEEQRELFVGCLNLFALFGSLGSQVLSDRYGRRMTFIVASVGFIIGLVLQASAQEYAMLMTGRALVGLGCGVGLAIDPLYISEISPAAHRGELVTWSEIGINVGIVLGFAMGLFFSGMNPELEWRALFLVGAILPCVMIYLAIRVMPESPRWYTLKFRYEEAKTVLLSIYPKGYNVDLVIDDMKEALERERIAENAVGWGAIFHPTPAFRRMLTVGLGIATAQQLVGIDAIQYYLLDVIEQTTDSETRQQILLILLGCVKLSCIFVAAKFFDSPAAGRRPLVFLSLAGMTIALLVLSITFYVAGKENPNSTLTVLGLGLYLAFFSFGMGPAAWLVPSEVFATCIRAKAMSMATVLNRLAATAMSSSFLTMTDAMTWQGFFLLLAGICLVTFLFLYFLLPETKGHSLEDMSLYFAEVTQDFSILDAERKIRVEQELQTVAAAGGTEGTTRGTLT